MSLLAFFGFLSAFGQRVVFNIAVVAMTNTTTNPAVSAVTNNSIELEYALPERPMNSFSQSPTGEFHWDPSTPSLLMGAMFYGYVVTLLISWWISCGESRREICVQEVAWHVSSVILCQDISLRAISWADGLHLCILQEVVICASPYIGGFIVQMLASPLADFIICRRLLSPTKEGIIHLNCRSMWNQVFCTATDLVMAGPIPFAIFGPSEKQEWSDGYADEDHKLSVVQVEEEQTAEKSE
ncbi:hypothetical protein CAPTEDRAFT_190385 [Capitella teleta]|uniref:Uncharacterized protein n=1 Tax=Capitella teleta TaxID=283909 RepID=R7UH34_CAPTE|nr:hypothetical protein CAPTEDRAFT_190385 [Capitella teleta]|eukprot:ELU02577.1 hypothetical protein CAPTEDRAFT_190385 [Capitella teleta]